MAVRTPFTTTTIARFCHVSHAAVCNWAKSGKLKTYRTPGGQYRIEPHVALEFMKQHGMPIPEELGGRRLKRILVVDDDAEVLALIDQVLGPSGAGYEVKTAMDGYTAGRLVYSFAPDLVLLDILMPGIDGVEVCRNLRSDPATAKTQILVVTGYPTAENVGKFREMGVDMFLEKPFKVNVLRAQVWSMIGDPIGLQSAAGLS